MKRRLALILAAAMLLTGCGDDEPVSETSEQTTEQTTVSTTVASIEYPEYPEFVEFYGNDQDIAAELKAFFSGADEYCGFSGLNVRATYHSGFLERAMEMSAANEDFDPDFESRDFGNCIGIEDGSFYFSIHTTYRHPAEYTADAPYVMHHYETGITYNQVTYTYRRDYFCFSCDTGVLEPITPPEGYDRIHAMGRDFMLCEGDNGYAVADRKTGSIYGLACENVRQCFFSGDDLFLVESIVDEDIERLRWLYVDNDGLYDEIMAEDVSISIERGVYNIVLSYHDYEWMYSLKSTYRFLDDEPSGRLRDYVSETYYPCSAMIVPNDLGYTTFLTLTDRNEKEHVLGSIFTEEKPQLIYGNGLDIHNTKNGLIYLGVDGFRPIMLEWDEKTDKVSAAFMPKFYVPEYSTVLCDGERLYFYAETDGDIEISMITSEDQSNL